MIILHAFKDKSHLDYIKLLTYKLYILHHKEDMIDVTGDSIIVHYDITHRFMLKYEAIDYIKNNNRYDHVYAYNVIFDDLILMCIKSMTKNNIVYL